MNRRRSTISVILIFALLQFFVPIFNVVAKVSCCDSQEMQCCQAEYPARIVCCIGHAETGLDESVSLRAVLQKKSSLAISIADHPETYQMVSLDVRTLIEYRPHDTPHLKHKLYKMYSSFLN